MIIAIDFDGTLTTGQFPDIGEPRYKVGECLQTLVEDGHELILWTCRKIKKDVEEMFSWMDKHGDLLQYFMQVNENLNNPGTGWEHVDPRKVYADIYIDDRNLLMLINGFDWPSIVRWVRFVEEKRSNKNGN